MNILFDFTQQSQVNATLENQPVAVMPVELAQKLLRMYATKLSSSNNGDIIDKHIATLIDLRNNRDLDGAIKASLLWIAERELIQNVQHENWDAYAVALEGAVMPDNGEIALNQAH
jgi:hypothetical protein